MSTPTPRTKSWKTPTARSGNGEYGWEVAADRFNLYTYIIIYIYIHYINIYIHTRLGKACEKQRKMVISPGKYRFNGITQLIYDGLVGLYMFALGFI